MGQKYKIAIIGGGANGVSIFCELVEQLSKLENPSRAQITLYEKSGIYGTGLAYGTHLDAHILNMPADSMSAIGDNPGHFLEWLKQPRNPALHPYFNTHAQGHDFVPRKIFGMYLSNMFQDSLTKAAAAGVEVRILNKEVFDVSEQGQDVVVTSTGKNAIYNQVILCLGNQPSSFGKELNGLPGYFHHAWPEQAIMNGIPNDEHVYIIGSSLTAIDALITLQQKGHTGKITMVSRHGILPKVRVLAAPYELALLTPEKISAITNNGEIELSLEDVLELFKKEFEVAGANPVDVSEILSLSTKSALDVLRHDIQKAEQGDMKYFDVLKAVDEVIGSIWNAISFEDRERFDAHYKAFWNAYDYPMPAQNARKVLAAMESGQLTVEGGFRSLKYDMTEKGMMITCAPKDKTQPSVTHRAKFVINATGQGLNIDDLETPLIYNALENGMITPHLLGGIDVDFDTGAVKNRSGKCSEKVYAVGSLTRGVHFYTNSINENAKCGKRTVTALVERSKQHLMLERQTPMKIEAKKPQKIALFIGSDISSHLLMNDLVPQLVQQGFKPYIYFARHRTSQKPSLPEIQTQGFFERTILANHIYPFLDAHPMLQGAACHSPLQLAQKYGIIVREIESVNDPNFIEELRQEGVEAGVVVRCYQKFGQEIIDYFNREPHQVLWNLHPGVLPFYQGVMTYFRSMNDGQATAGYSLHVIDENWDAGPVLDIRPESLDLTKPMLTNYCEIAPSGVPIIMDNLARLANNETISSIPQKPEEQGYFSTPTREEMDEFLSKGLRLVDPADMKAIYIGQFSVEGTEHERHLSQLIDKVIAEHLRATSDYDEIPRDPLDGPN